MLGGWLWESAYIWKELGEGMGANQNTMHAVLKELIKFTLKITKYKQYLQQAKFHNSMKTLKYTVMNRL